MTYPKRLIEVDLPIKRISAHARREKPIHLTFMSKCRGFLAQCLNRQNDHESPGSMRIKGNDAAYSITRDRKTSIETSIVTLSQGAFQFRGKGVV